MPGNGFGNPLFTYSDGVNNPPPTANSTVTELSDATTGIDITVALAADTPELITLWVGEANQKTSPTLDLTFDDESVRVDQDFTGNEVIQFEVESDVVQNLYIRDIVAKQSQSKTIIPFDGEFAIAVASVPEPTSMSLAEFALLGLFARPRRPRGI